VDVADEHRDITYRYPIIDLGSNEIPGLIDVTHVVACTGVPAIRVALAQSREERMPFDLFG